jgi:hypothetical protein
MSEEVKSKWYSNTIEIVKEVEDKGRRKPISLVNTVPIMDNVLLKVKTVGTITGILMSNKSGNPGGFKQSTFEVVGYGPDTRDIHLGVFVEINDTNLARSISVEGNERQIEKLRDYYNELPREDREVLIKKGESVEIIAYILTPNYNIVYGYIGEATPIYISKSNAAPSNLVVAKPKIILEK